MKAGKNWSSPQGSNKQQQRCFARLLRLEISNRSLIPSLCLFFFWDASLALMAADVITDHPCLIEMSSSQSQCDTQWEDTQEWHGFVLLITLFSLSLFLHKLFWGSRENQIRSVCSHVPQTAGEPPVVPQSAYLPLHAISHTCERSSFVWTLPQCISSQSATAAAMAESAHLRSSKVWGKAGYWH